MKGSPAVIEALNTAYRLLLAIEQQAHVQEHLLESEGWDRLSDWFHAVEQGGHDDLIHPLMKRINALGGLPDSRYAFDPQCWMPGDIVPAARSMLLHLNDLHRAYVEVCEAADPVDDYVTEQLSWDHQGWIEKKIRKFERRLAKIELVGPERFLAENMD